MKILSIIIFIIFIGLALPTIMFDLKEQERLKEQEKQEKQERLKEQKKEQERLKKQRRLEEEREKRRSTPPPLFCPNCGVPVLPETEKCPQCEIGLSRV